MAAKTKKPPTPIAPPPPRDPVTGLLEDAGMFLTIMLNNYERARTGLETQIAEANIADPLFGTRHFLDMARYENAIRHIGCVWGAANPRDTLEGRFIGVRSNLLRGEHTPENTRGPDSVAVHAAMFRGARDFLETTEGILDIYDKNAARVAAGEAPTW